MISPNSIQKWTLTHVSAAQHPKMDADSYLCRTASENVWRHMFLPLPKMNADSYFCRTASENGDEHRSMNVTMKVRMGNSPPKHVRPVPPISIPNAQPSPRHTPRPRHSIDIASVESPLSTVCPSFRPCCACQSFIKSAYVKTPFRGTFFLSVRCRFETLSRFFSASSSVRAHRQRIR